MAEAVLTRLLEIGAGLPGVATEKSGRHVAFSVRGRRFAWFLDDHHGDGRVALACKAPPGALEGLVAADPERWFAPAYLGSRGWVGLRLDLGEPDWEEVRGLLAGAYELAAPRRPARGKG